MAYNVPDADGYVYKPRSAQAQVLGYAEEDALVREDKEFAAANGVTAPEFVNYAAAMENYESRPDTEPLAQRRARENAVAFADQNQFRATVDLAGPVQSSSVGTTSVEDGTGYYFDDQADVPFQPAIHQGDMTYGSGVPAPDTSGTGDPDADALDNTADTDDDNDSIVDTSDTQPYNPNA